ncbi:IS21-like element helper ATPase IstB [bacterium]|nr:IS21-like element helper ATPase IstB [bacterium]
MDRQTIQKLEKMKLHGMARAFRNTMETGMAEKMTPDEMVALLVDAEWDDRHNRRLAKLLKNAGFRYPATFDQIDFSLNRNLDKNLMIRLSGCQWIAKHKNIILTGHSGTGKSWLSSALGHQACLYGHSTGYFLCSKLFNQLKLARIDGSYLKEIERLQKLEVIIFDDFGLESFETKSRLAFLDILEDRHGRKSTVIVSQIPVSKWHEIIGDATIADAICDRIIHSAHRIELKGESVRKLYSKKEES